MIRGITFADQITTSDDFAHLQNKWFNGVSGVTKGCKVTADNDNVYVGAGYFIICGRLVRIVGTETIESEVVQQTKYCKVVFEIDLSKTNSTTAFEQGYFKIISSFDSYPDLIQEDLDADGNVYQMEFARFVKNTTSIISFESSTIDLKVSDVWDRLENEFDTRMQELDIYVNQEITDMNNWVETTQTNINNEWNTYYNSKTVEIDNEVDAKIDELNDEIAKVQDGSLVSQGEFNPTITHSIYKSNQDANGIYRTVTYKRADGTTYKVSELSNVDDMGNYTTQTITYYKADGSSVDKTEVYIITYNGDGDIESEVLSNA